MSATTNVLPLQVYLPEEQQKALYSSFLAINRKAMLQAKSEIYNPAERYVIQKDLMENFNIGDKQLQEWRRLGLKRIKIGKTYRYDIEDVYKIIELTKE
ncbi:hypothetical protein GMA11_04350 [Granulicatella sp. zg-ZJ]|uniref:hypothetical protein n=1 Tax=Granulicatella sp. zg-ZJ TaxID=2678504 RepID=UPI0013D854FB|nr:hypothetical protein [Granulicatella sp. zg-ZJ]NEW62620.1 hypothetical protein [Granulicatella sp. zg-ZJ]